MTVSGEGKEQNKNLKMQVLQLISRGCLRTQKKGDLTLKQPLLNINFYKNFSSCSGNPEI